MKNQVIFSVKGFVVFFLACSLFAGCMPHTQPFGGNEQQSQLFSRYKELGRKYLENSDYIEVQKSILCVYHIEFLEKWAGCEDISMGLQFISMQASPSMGSLVVALLAESSSSEREFCKKIVWYDKHVRNAKNFLNEMKEEQKFLKSIQDKNFENFMVSISGYRKPLCAPETVFLTLIEFPFLL